MEKSRKPVERATAVSEKSSGSVPDTMNTNLSCPVLSPAPRARSITVSYD
jgi:hypothetical protein